LTDNYVNTLRPRLA